MDERQSKIEPDLILAYKNTLFQANVGGEVITLRVGERCPELQEVFEQHSVTTACYITAYNPFGRLLSMRQNQARNAKLKSDLAAKYPIFEGVGVDPEGEWEGEPSFLVLGVNLTEAEKLAELHQQNAVVFVGTDFVPTLVFTR